MDNINFISLIYDLAAIALVFGMIRRGTRLGFTRSFVRVAGYSLVAAASVVVSRVGSVLIYRSLLEPKILGLLEDSLSVTGSADSLLSELRDALSSLPAVSYVLFDLAGAAGSDLEAIADESVSSIAGTVADQVVSPVISPVLRGLIFVLVFILGCFIVRALAKTSSVVRDIPVVGVLDRLLGGVFGIVEGLIVLAVLCVLLYAALALWEGRWSWFTRDNIYESYVFRWIYAFVTGDTAA